MYCTSPFNCNGVTLAATVTFSVFEVTWAAALAARLSATAATARKGIALLIECAIFLLTFAHPRESLGATGVRGNPPRALAGASCRLNCPVFGTRSMVRGRFFCPLVRSAPVTPELESRVLQAL